MGDKEKMWAIWATVLLSLSFLTIDDNDTRMVKYAFDPQGNGNMIHLKSWIWYVCEYVGIGILLFVISRTARRLHYAFTITLGLCVCTLVDFVLTGNDMWTPYISMNVVSIVVLSIVLADIYINER